MYLLLAGSQTAAVKPAMVPTSLIAITAKKQDANQRTGSLLNHWTHTAHLSAPASTLPSLSAKRSDAQQNASWGRRQRRAAGKSLQRPAGQSANDTSSSNAMAWALFLYCVADDTTYACLPNIYPASDVVQHFKSSRAGFRSFATWSCSATEICGTMLMRQFLVLYVNNGC